MIIAEGEFTGGISVVLHGRDIASVTAHNLNREDHTLLSKLNLLEREYEAANAANPGTC